ncbi:MAG: Capsular polysaccharide biosynthesis protein WcbQ [Rhodanobacteraceae bacterium]|jgi:phosphoglycerol transferase MdoB-like AlkP superfamily enzyme|nr:MAG: Capsular polysaccharide biosynthesis protein WcbQ [Rhodanobacteraceae bacterium]
MKDAKSLPAGGKALRLLLQAGVVVVLVVALWFATWVMDRASIRLAWFAYGWTYGFFVNAIPVAMVFLLLLAAFNRALLAFGVTLLLALALYAINFLKLKYLRIPVTFSDVYVLGNLHVATLKLLLEYVKAWQILAALLAAAGSGVALAWLERRFFGRRSVARALVALAALAGLVSAGAGAGWVGKVYGYYPLRVAPYSPVLTQVHAGLISSILNADVLRRYTANAPVDVAAAQAFLAMATPAAALPAPATTAAARPDIVVIQSESFFDPGILKDLADTDAALPNLHRALAAGVGGTMDPPTFGGSTLRTEFEVLTGVPMAAYPNVEFPYLQIVQPTLPGFVRALRRDGYATVAIHPNHRTFWNRDVAFKEIGFQRFISQSGFPADALKDGWYLSDQAMTDQIIATLDKASTPTLVFAVSIEAHGPYLDDPVDDPARRDAIPAPSGLHGVALLEYRNYMYHIQNADRQMGRLWDYLVKRGRPFLLVFYGDHLPALTHVYAQTGFDDGQPGPDQFVPWFIVGTGVEPQKLHVESWMLGGDILRMAGVPLSPYYQLVAKAQAALAAHPDAQQQNAIRQGMNALAQMELRGTLDAFVAGNDARERDHAPVAANR